MDQFDLFLEFIDTNVIFCLVPLLVTLILIKAIFKNRYKVKPVLNVVRWAIISYTLISLVYYAIGVIFFPAEFEFLERAIGPYKWSLLVNAALGCAAAFYAIV